MNQRIQLASIDDQRNAEARETVRRRVSWPANLTPANVTYHSRGHALLIGTEADVQPAARALQGRGLASLTLLVTESDANSPGNDTVDPLRSSEPLVTQTLTQRQLSQLRINGYLGAFSAQLDDEDAPLDIARALIERDGFDLILDLAPTSHTQRWELPPPGYVVLQWQDVEQRSDILDDFVGLVGEFDKPRYFQVNSDLCAHSTSGNIGCTRCLDVCPADAISSIQGRIESHIEIDPFLCQGVGSCTSTTLPLPQSPSGSIQALGRVS